MSSSTYTLPLFPLNVVLFPGASLPLMIFEERYKLMVQRCLDGDSRFGVVLIKSGAEVGEPAEPHSVGTVAEIAQWHRFDDGRMQLSVTGESRFRIGRVTQLRPYLEGEVEMLEDEDGVSLAEAEMQRIREAVVRQVRLLAGLRGGWIKELKMPEDPVALSYFIPAVLQAGLAEKQALLEEASTAKRLEAELRLLGRESEQLRERVSEELGGRSFG